MFLMIPEINWQEMAVT